MLARLTKLVAISAAIVLVAACSGSSGVTNMSGGWVRIVMSTATSGSTLAAGAGTIASSTIGVGGSSVVPNHEGDGGDQPGANFAEAHAMIASFLARNLAGELVAVDMSLPISVDLLALVNGNTFTLPIGTLPPATYDQIVVVIVGLDLVTKDGTKITITPPGGGWTAVVPVDSPSWSRRV